MADFAALSTQAKEVARQEYRESTAQDNDWYDFVFEDAVRMAALLGIEIDTHSIFFSGFSSQGDGASFKGSYSYAQDMLKDILREAPQDTALHRLAERLVVLQVSVYLEHGQRLSATISVSGRSYHSRTMTVDETFDDEDLDPTPEQAKELTDILRDYADWIYGQLRQEDDYLNSDEAIDEQLADQNFDECGAII
jgi:hypothetical protein